MHSGSSTGLWPIFNKVFAYQQELLKYSLSVCKEHALFDQFGFLKHSAFEEDLKTALEESFQTSKPLTWVFLDGDMLRKVNDELGHLVTDLLVLPLILQMVNEKLGNEIQLYRPYRGDEGYLIMEGDPKPHLRNLETLLNQLPNFHIWLDQNKQTIIKNLMNNQQWYEDSTRCEQDIRKIINFYKAHNLTFSFGAATFHPDNIEMNPENLRYIKSRDFFLDYCRRVIEAVNLAKGKVRQDKPIMNSIIKNLQDASEGFIKLLTGRPKHKIVSVNLYGLDLLPEGNELPFIINGNSIVEETHTDPVLAETT
ncbi:MAG: GGDEF domain-containing protein [Candidatus Caenarcaniphilales bacterium]|nr:GGDEF domain-containing protein [Candidatus Caenarcaniphilales bacterium]